MKHIITYLSFFLLIFSTTPVSGQQSPSRRPKVALVLSGGGAKGLAEIPLIEAIEEEGIPVDFVLGTSMGSLLGSFYAAGYSPKEIRQIMTDLDFLTILNDSPAEIERIPREPFTTKSDNHISLGIGAKTIGAAPGIIGDQKILSELDNYLSRVLTIKDFDKLSIPYRAIGTDIRNGQQIVFDKGSIVDAVRASMSLPAIFTPAPAGNGVYAMDGGLVNNLPIRLAKEMGADIVIAMDVASATDVDPTKIKDMVSVGVLVFNLIISSNAIEQHKLADILFHPDLKKYNTMDFAHSRKIIIAGEECVNENRQELHNLALKLEKMGVKLEPKDKNRISHYSSLPDKEIEQIDIIDISFAKTNIVPKDKEFKKFLNKKLDNRTKKELSKALMTARNKYHLSSLSYELFDGSTPQTCKMVLKANHYAQDMAKFFIGGQSCLYIARDSKDNLTFRVLPDFTIGMYGITPINYYWKAFFGNNNGLILDLMPTIAKAGKTTFAGEFGIQANYGSRNPAYNFMSSIAINDPDKGIDINANFMIRVIDILALRIGALYNYDSMAISGNTYNTYSLFSSFVFDTTENDPFAFKGIKFDGIIKSGNYVGTDKNVTALFALQTRLEQRIPIVPDYCTLGYDISFNTIRYPSVLCTGYTDIGGINGMCGFTRENYRRDSAIAGIFFQQKILEANGFPIFLHLKGKISYFDSFDPIIHTSDKLSDSTLFNGNSFPDNLIAGYSAFLGIKTRMGSLVLGGSQNSTGKWYITLGFM